MTSPRAITLKCRSVYPFHSTREDHRGQPFVRKTFAVHTLHSIEFEPENAGFLSGEGWNPCFYVSCANGTLDINEFEDPTDAERMRRLMEAGGGVPL